MKLNRDNDTRPSINNTSGSRQNDNLNQGAEKNRQQQQNSGDIINGQNDSVNNSGQTQDEVGSVANR